MDLAAIRARLITKMSSVGFNPYTTMPGSPDLPAAIVGSPTEIRYTQTMSGRVEVDLPVRLVVSSGDEDDGFSRLDTAVSTGASSVFLALRTTAADDPWRQLVVTKSTNWGYVTLDGGAVGLVADLNLTITTNL